MEGGDAEILEPGVHEDLLKVGRLGESILHAPAVAGLSELFSLTDGLDWVGLEC